MEIKEYRKYCEDEILRLYASVGWTAYTERPEALRRGFDRSLLTLAAYEGAELGSALLRAVLKRYENVRQIELATDDTPKTKAFYRSMGFRELSEIGCCGFMLV